MVFRHFSVCEKKFKLNYDKCSHSQLSFFKIYINLCIVKKKKRKFNYKYIYIYLRIPFIRYFIVYLLT